MGTYDINHFLLKVEHYLTMLVFLYTLFTDYIPTHSTFKQPHVRQSRTVVPIYPIRTSTDTTR